MFHRLAMWRCCNMHVYMRKREREIEREGYGSSPSTLIRRRSPRLIRRRSPRHGKVTQDM